MIAVCVCVCVGAFVTCLSEHKSQLNSVRRSEPVNRDDRAR